MGYSTLTENENEFLRHISMWGSDGYPVQKLSGSRWIWREFFGIKGAPVVYKTKRECVEAIERYLDVLRDKAAERVEIEKATAQDEAAQLTEFQMQASGRLFL